MSRLFFNEQPLVINRLGAKVLGLNESIVVQQIHYWLDINKKAKINEYDGNTWTYNTYENWQSENFDFWSVKTIQRIFDNLEKKGILIKGNYNKAKYDRTLWVTLNYTKLDELLEEYEQINSTNVETSTKGQVVQMSNSNIRTDCPNGKGQVVQMEKDRLSTPIPENTTENTTEISTTTETVDKQPVVNINKELIESKTHLLLDSLYKKNKVNKWNKERLEKSIELFLDQEGQYFSLLEKIYIDDKNFVKTKSNSTNNKQAVKTRFHNINQTYNNYTPNELEKILLESQKEKFK